jgi:hypothetical protein
MQDPRASVHSVLAWDIPNVARDIINLLGFRCLPTTTSRMHFLMTVHEPLTQARRGLCYALVCKRWYVAFWGKGSLSDGQFWEPALYRTCCSFFDEQYCLARFGAYVDDAPELHAWGNTPRLAPISVQKSASPHGFVPVSFLTEGYLDFRDMLIEITEWNSPRAIEKWRKSPTPWKFTLCDVADLNMDFVYAHFDSLIAEYTKCTNSTPILANAPQKTNFQRSARRLCLQYLVCVRVMATVVFWAVFCMVGLHVRAKTEQNLIMDILPAVVRQLRDLCAHSRELHAWVAVVLDKLQSLARRIAKNYGDRHSVYADLLCIMDSISASTESMHARSKDMSVDMPCSSCNLCPSSFLQAHERNLLIIPWQDKFANVDRAGWTKMQWLQHPYAVPPYLFLADGELFSGWMQKILEDALFCAHMGRLCSFTSATERHPAGLQTYLHVMHQHEDKASRGED